MRLQCEMPCSKLEVSTAQHGTLSGAGYLQSRTVHPFRVTKGKGFQLKDFDPGDTRGLEDGQGRGGRTPPTRNRVARRGAGHALRSEPLVAIARFSRLWTQLARTARSSMSCRGLTHRDAGRLVREQPSSEDLDHDFMFGATRGAFQKGDGSASSTGRTMKRFSSCGCMTKMRKRQQLPPPLV